MSFQILQDLQTIVLHTKLCLFFQNNQCLHVHDVIYLKYLYIILHFNLKYFQIVHVQYSNGFSLFFSSSQIIRVERDVCGVLPEHPSAGVCNAGTDQRVPRELFYLCHMSPATGSR